MPPLDSDDELADALSDAELHELLVKMAEAVQAQDNNREPV